MIVRHSDARIWPMGDLLRIPDDKRGGGGLASLFERPDRGWSFWIIVLVLVVLNC